MRHADYTARYGPTTGDRVRLADTNLWVTVQDDHVGYGDEPLFGFAKTLRHRLLQDDQVARESELDAIVVGVLLIDALVGIVKTCIGIKDGRVVGLGTVGQPARYGQDLVVGPRTHAVPGYGLIATAGGVDSHVHFPTPRVVPPALSAGVTTLLSAGFEEPPYAMARMYAAFEDLPINLGLQACARTADPADAEPVLAAGALGLKVHEDHGASPELIDAALRAAEAHDVAVSLHTDGLNESAEVDDTLAAIGGRTVHAYHVEGSAGGHLPDNLLLLTEPSVIASSTTPSFPYGRFTAVEHVDMILAVHGGDADVPDDVGAVRERIHEASMGAEGPLQEFGAISITNSDSQGVGRMGETLRRTWQLCDAMKTWREQGEGASWAGRVPGADDNARVLQYLAKYTVEPARVHGLRGEVGSLLPGHLADIVLWRPILFGVKPELVLKCGFEAWGPAGVGNGSVERIQPVTYGPQWGGIGAAGTDLATTYVSQLAMDAGFAGSTGRRVAAVTGTRGLTRDDMLLNRLVPALSVDPADGRVAVDGRHLTSPPVDRVPLNRAFFFS